MSCLLAWCIALGLGVGHANPQGTGEWYMAQYDHALLLTSPVAEVALERGHARLSLSYDGRYAVRSVVGSNTDGTAGSGPMEHYSGSGKLANLCASWVQHAGPWRLEGGPCLLKASWEERVPDYVYWGSGKWNAWPTNLSANHFVPGASLAVGYDRGPLTIALGAKLCELRGTDTNGNNMPSICRGVSEGLTIRWYFGGTR